MPKKILGLKSDLMRAGWELIAGGNGSHTKWVHAEVSGTVILSGKDGADANPRPVRDIGHSDMNPARCLEANGISHGADMMTYALEDGVPQIDQRRMDDTNVGSLEQVEAELAG